MFQEMSALNYMCFGTRAMSLDVFKRLYLYITLYMYIYYPIIYKYFSVIPCITLNKNITLAEYVIILPADHQIVHYFWLSLNTIHTYIGWCSTVFTFLDGRVFSRGTHNVHTHASMRFVRKHSTQVFILKPNTLSLGSAVEHMSTINSHIIGL